jgi:ribosomal-protein-alanine N-acetyltransferase
VIELRELASDDVDALLRVFDPISTRYLDRGPMDTAEARRYVANAVSSAARVPRTLHVLGLGVDGDLAGVVKLDLEWQPPSVSYILRPDVWGRGHATEALRRLLALAFGPLDLRAVQARHRPDNPASGRALAKAGFVHTGTVSGFETYAAERPDSGSWSFR